MAEAAKVQFINLEKWKEKQREQITFSDGEILLDMHEVVRKVGVSKSTITRLYNAGNFPKKRRPSPGTVRWLKSEIDAWMKAQEGLKNGQ